MTRLALAAPAFCVALTAFVGGATQAQTYPEPGTVLIYDRLTVIDGAPSNAVSLEVTFLNAPDGQVALQSCTETYCEVNVFRDISKYLASLYFDPVEAGKFPDAATILADENTIAVTIVNETGGAAFPLQDGKRLDWIESWESDDFSAVYAMSQDQHCCVDAPLPAALSTELWELTYHYVQTDQTDQLSEGQSTLLFDPVLGWWISITTTSQGGIEGDTYSVITRQELREVILP